MRFPLRPYLISLLLLFILRLLTNAAHYSVVFSFICSIRPRCPYKALIFSVSLIIASSHNKCHTSKMRNHKLAIQNILSVTHRPNSQTLFLWTSSIVYCRHTSTTTPSSEVEVEYRHYHTIAKAQQN